MKPNHLNYPKCGAATYPKSRFYAGGVIIVWKCTRENCDGKHEEDKKK